MPKLSIIVPVYNSDKYLKECLDSLINQTYEDIEVICVNDGSTDNSLQILEEYFRKDNRIKIINKENGGVSSARNAGLKIASGEFITFVDDDDYLDFNAYEETLKYIGNTDLVCFGCKVFGDAHYAHRTSDEKYYKIKFKGLKILNPKTIFETDVSVCNKIFKKSIIDINNISFPEGLNYEDAEFYFKYIICAKSVYYLDKYFYNYRRSDESIMSDTFNGTDKAIHHLYIVKNIYDFWCNNHYIEKNEKVFIKLFKNCFSFAYWNSKLGQRPKVLYVASEYAQKFSETLAIKSNFVKNLAKKRYSEIYVPDLKFYQKISNKVKIFDILDRCKKEYIYIVGIKIKKHHPNIEIIRRLNFIEDEIIKIKDKENSNV